MSQQVAAMNRKNLQKLAETLSKSARHFTKHEVECLIRLYNTIVRRPIDPNTRGGIDRNTFRNILHNTFTMTDDMIMDRGECASVSSSMGTHVALCIVTAVLLSPVFRGFDKDNDSYISVSEWIEGLSVFLRGTLDEKIKYCFEVYDLNSDGFISREEMFHMLKNSLLKQPTEEDPDEGIKDLVEITLKKMDHDHDSKLSFLDFEKAVREENLLLEAFGPCLPDSKSIMAFESQAFSEPNDL
ncbi:EF-hand calcium-binding domain-containing protein 1 isoform X1 [Bufo gargarizans]|uniref:EF-hand calcium-binding domain-containing protein 1 isoform X1 n=1 Tax=Bufo gargarizans TaxID=30331 RepID=UPI001CF2D746|nr:EF-hand calcium-binding domain-containing protein 1 isoform X1 [Bufo gargarizans]